MKKVKVIIVTSRIYFTETPDCKFVAGSEFFQILKEHYLSDVKIEDVDNDYIKSLPDDEKDIMNDKLHLYTFFSRDIDHGYIADYMYNWVENEELDFHLKRFDVDSEDSEYIVYLAPCYPLWLHLDDFNIRQNYLASIVNTCLKNINKDDNINNVDQVYLIAHDKDMYPYHLCKNPDASDIIDATGLDYLIKENVLGLSDIYCFMHSRESDMYVEFVEKISNGVTVQMCDVAESILKFKLL